MCVPNDFLAIGAACFRRRVSSRFQGIEAAKQTGAVVAVRWNIIDVYQYFLCFFFNTSLTFASMSAARWSRSKGRFNRGP